MGPTRFLADYACAAKYDDLPKEVVKQAKVAIAMPGNLDDLDVPAGTYYITGIKQYVSRNPGSLFKSTVIPVTYYYLSACKLLDLGKIVYVISMGVGNDDHLDIIPLFPHGIQFSLNISVTFGCKAHINKYETTLTL